jgi:hypothetical protein
VSALAVVLRWLHIVPAVVAGGASVFVAVALLPALGEMPEETRRAARERINARWRVIVMICITLLLASGLANFVLYQGPAHRGQALYQGLFGLKFLAALGVFFIASALTGRSEALQPMRESARFWASLNALLIVAIVLISGVLRGLPAAH